MDGAKYSFMDSEKGGWRGVIGPRHGEIVNTVLVMKIHVETVLPFGWLWVSRLGLNPGFSLAMWLYLPLTLTSASLR